MQSDKAWMTKQSCWVHWKENSPSVVNSLGLPHQNFVREYGDAWRSKTQLKSLLLWCFRYSKKKCYIDQLVWKAYLFKFKPSWTLVYAGWVLIECLWRHCFWVLPVVSVLSVNIELCSARLGEDRGGHSGRKEATTLSTTTTAKFRVEDWGGGSGGCSRSVHRQQPQQRSIIASTIHHFDYYYSEWVRNQ